MRKVGACLRPGNVKCVEALCPERACTAGGVPPLAFRAFCSVAEAATSVLTATLAVSSRFRKCFIV